MTRDNDQLELFPSDDDPPPKPTKPKRPSGVGPALTVAELITLAHRISPTIHLGTSSWSFPGWNGIVYDRSASEAVLARSGLAAYAQHPLFRSVGIDRTFYAPIDASQFARYAADVPDQFRFLCKAHDQITSPIIFQRGASRAAADPSPYFLDAAYAADAVVAPFVDGLGPKAGPLVFQFTPMSKKLLGDPARFIDRLAAFLTALPRGPLYAVEIRNRELLTPAYAAALRAAQVAHCITIHPTMPSPADQSQIASPDSAPALVVRWMLNSKFDFETARDEYAPFNRLVDEDPTSRAQIAALAILAAARNQPVYVVVNNKAEGSSPLSVRKLAESIVQTA